MVSTSTYTYTPTYYTSLHDSITSICKSILPFSLKKKRLQAAEHRLAKLQSDNLKWQQDSFHQILNLMGLHKEGILDEPEVSAFRSNLLETLIASPADQHEQPVVLRDKLLFLQELLYAKCISEDEYHSSKRPLLQRLAVQGAEIEARDVIVANPHDIKENAEEEWSVIDLKDEKLQVHKQNLHSRNKVLKTNHSARRQIKEATSVFSFASSHKKQREKEKSIFSLDQSQFCVYNSKIKNDLVLRSKENPFWRENESETRSVLMQESSSPNEASSTKGRGSVDGSKKQQPLRSLWFHREGHKNCGENGHDLEEKGSKSAKKQWGFEGLKKWKRNESEDDSETETAPLPLSERSDGDAYLGSRSRLGMGEGPNTREIKKKLHSNGSPSDFFIDKVLGDNIKKELSQIQSELSTTNPNMIFSNDQIEAIATTLPVDKADLKKFFPKSWCDRYGDVVLDVVRKEFKDHVGDMENMRNAAREKKHSNSTRWATFDDDENCHPNLFAHSVPLQQQNLKSAGGSPEHQNPFWSPRKNS